MSESASVDPAPDKESSDKRRDRRFPCANSAVDLDVVGQPGRLTGRVTDVSASGIGLLVKDPPVVGSKVSLVFNGARATGEIRFSNNRGDGSFDVGLRLSGFERTNLPKNS